MPADLNLSKRTLVWPALACATFLALAIVVIPLPGIQNDEALFTTPLYEASVPSLSIGRHSHQIQVMVLSYLGELKTLIYASILRVFPASVWSLRLPAVFFCLGTIILTWMYTRRVAGTKTAAIAAVLLAFDPSFLLTGTFDWGPVALQHLLLMAGLVCLLRWYDRGSTAMLAVAFFAWGLGLWDKALFIWPLSGLAVAALCVYPREVLSRIKPREAGLALGAFLLGAFPFFAYNAEHRGATAGQNAKFSLDGFRYRKFDAHCIRRLEGSALFDLWTPSTPSQGPVTASAGWERSCEWLAQKVGRHRQTRFEWFLGIALCAGMFAVNRRERRQMIFLLLAMTLGFLEMLVTTGAGIGAHHAVLLWPFPVVLFAIPFGALAGARLRMVRYAALAVVASLLVQDVLTMNQYLTGFLADGFPPIWTDAIYGLADAVRARSGNRFEDVDWGYGNSLEFLTRGRADISENWECLAQSTSASGSDCGVPIRLARSNTFFIEHTSDNGVFPQVNENLQRIAAASSYGESIDQTIEDSHGRPVFQIVHFYRK